MKKTKTYVGNSTTPSINYIAEKKSFTAPKILSEFVDEDGVPCYNLDNGRTQSCDSYNKLWKPQKGKVLPAYHKIDIDSTHIK